tara:strand:+ start:778 stop:1014 length:237 start_codon:yes stop_codon:yes gene_type:complete
MERKTTYIGLSTSSASRGDPDTEQFIQRNAGSWTEVFARVDGSQVHQVSIPQSVLGSNLESGLGSGGYVLGNKKTDDF